MKEMPQYPQKERLVQGTPNVAIFISGGGTNLQELINGVENKTIDANISLVLSNKPGVYGLERAIKHDIPTAVFPTKGKIGTAQRTDSLKNLASFIRHYHEAQRPDVIVLAGYMVVLDDDFIKSMQELEIPIINLHPALLTEDSSDTVQTSKGPVPVVRGSHAIEDAFKMNLPVSGVTVHQILPAENKFDIGPVILTEEVERLEGDTIKDWEERIHEAEYRTLPAALNIVLGMIKGGFDVSKKAS